MVTVGMAKEFARDYLGTLKANGMKNTFRSVKEIARLMNISVDKAIRFIGVAKANDFMCDDNNTMPSYMPSLTLFKVYETNLLGGKANGKVL